MSSIEAQVVRREGFKPTEKIGDAELANLISACGNSEAKPITLFAIRNGESYERKDLKTAVTELQGGRGKGWDLGSGTLDSYCSWRMTDVGLVDPDDGPPITYTITQYGQNIGIPLAGLLLDFSLRHNDIFLNKLFGQSHSSSPIVDTVVNNSGDEIESKKRSPAIRLSIFRALVNLNLEDARKQDLMDRLMEKDPHIIQYNLRKLDDAGIINYAYAGRREPIVNVRIDDNCPAVIVPLITYKTFSIRVFEALRQFQQLHPGEFLTIDAIVSLLPKEARYKKVKSSVSIVLSHFERLGYIMREGFTRYARTHIDIPPHMKEMIAELLSIIDRFKQLDPEIIEQGNRLADFFGSHPNEVATLMEKAREASDHAHKDV